MTYSKKIRRWRQVAVIHPRGFVERKLRIPNIMGDEVAFSYQWAQRQYSDIKKEIHKAGIPLRFWGIKWRRAGFTSCESAEGFAYSYGKDNARIGILAHLEERAKEILDNYRQYYKSLCTWHPELKLELSKDNIFGIKWQNSNSKVLIGTAENPIKVRGDGIHRLQNSEAAHFFDKFTAVMQEVCPVVPPLPGSEIINESTGSLMGSAPHEHYMQAVSFEDWLKGKRGHNEFIRKFFCWLEAPNERIPFGSEREMHELFELIRFSEPRLAEMNAHYKLSPEQIHASWRMYHLQSNNDFDYFCREFPYSEKMAWASGSASFFGTYEIGMAKPEHPIEQYLFEDPNILTVFDDYSALRKVDRLDPYSTRPTLKIWAHPIPGRKYVLGSDSASGDYGGDPSTGYIIDRDSREMMCNYHGLLRPDEAAHINVSLCRIYNNAMAGPETNPGGGGFEAINMMQRLQYHNIYVFRIRDGVEGVKYSQKLGWWTSSRTRPLMLNGLRQLFMDCVYERAGTGMSPGVFRDEDLFTEMRTFGTDPKTGTPRANVNCFDDRVIALAIAHQIATDEVQCTGKDPIREYHKLDNQRRKPFDQSAMVSKVMTPDKALLLIMGEQSNFMRNKFEI